MAISFFGNVCLEKIFVTFDFLGSRFVLVVVQISETRLYVNLVKVYISIKQVTYKRLKRMINV